MIKDLRENDLGFMVGTFYSSIFKYDIEVLFDRDISLEYIEKNIASNLESDGKTIVFTFTLDNGKTKTTAVTLP